MEKQIIKPQILDTDTQIQEVANMCALDIVNLRVGNTRVQKPLNGTIDIASPTPLADTTCFRAIEDEKTGTIFEFHRNTGESVDSIVQYLPQIPQRQMIMQTPALNFQENYPILSCPIEERFLMPTDDLNDLRYIDWQKGNRIDKKLKATILFGKPEAGVNKIFTDGTVYTMTFQIPIIGTITTVIWTVPNNTYEDNVVEGAIGFKDAFNANTSINPYFVATYCGCGEVSIGEITASGDANGNITTCSIGVTNAPDTQDPKALVIYDNVYPQTITDFHINRARRTPQKQPTVRLIADATKKANLIYNKNPQFAFRLFYTDKHYTAFSPISKLAITDTDCLGKQALAFNGIDIDFTDLFTNPLAVDSGGILQNADYLQEIDMVQIAWRDGNSGIWQIAKTLNRCDFGLHRQWWVFYNDEISLSLAENENPDNKPFDHVPLTAISDTLATIASGEGARSFPMNVVDGYNPTCPDLRLVSDSVVLSPCSRKYNLTVWGRVKNPYFTNNLWLDDQQPIWQMEDGTIGFGGMGSLVAGFVSGLTSDYQQVLASKGFPAYLAGTPYLAISTQYVVGAGGANYADTSFGVFLGDSDDNRNAIRETLDDFEVWIRWDFLDIPNGNYIFRVASHWCSRGDVLGKGSMYDLNIGIEYQKTSTYVSECYVGSMPIMTGNSCVTSARQKEIVITLPYDDSSTENAVANAGVVDIIDMTDPSIIDATWVADGYVIDANGSNDPNDLILGERVEYQKYYCPKYTTTIPKQQYPPDPSQAIYKPFYLDHNGYFFGGSNNRDFIWILESDRPSLRITGWDSADNDVIIKDEDTSCYYGGLSELYSGALAATTIKMAETGIVNPIIIPPASYRKKGYSQFICWTPNTYIRDARTTVTVEVADQNGNPLSGILSVLTFVGRYGLTDSLGTFSTLRYRRDPSISAIPTQTWATNYRLAIGAGCCIDMKVNDQLTDLSPPAGTMAYYASPFTEPAIPPFQLIVEYNEAFKALKKGSTIYAGLVYYDTANRCTAVEATKFAYYAVPYWSEGLLNYYLTWEIYSLPPEWANKYQILIAMPPYNYVWFVADAVKYMITFKNNLNKIETTFSSGAATEIHISTNSISLFNEQNKNSSVQYTFAEGDRLRLIFDNNNGLITELIDVPILSYEDGYVVIEFSSDLPEIKTGFVCEIYNQTTILSDKLIFNEVGMCYPIIEDSGIRYHGKGEDNAVISFTAQDQDSAQPATGYLDFTNTYQHTRTMNTNQDADLGWQQHTPLVESQNVSDFFPSDSLGIGRPNAVNPNSRQVNYATMVTYCNPYLPNKNLNGLCQFELLSRQTFDTTMGAIQCGAAIQGVLIIVGSTGSMSVYLGQSQMVAQNVAGVIALNSAVLGGWRSFADNFSTRHPLSFVVYKGEAYWYDANNKAVIKYTTGGCYSINKNPQGLGGVEKTMRDISETLPFDGTFGQSDNLVFAAVDKFYKEYVIRFPNITEENPSGFKTYVYDLLNQVWRGRYDLGSTVMAGTQAGLVSFVNSLLWEHDKDVNNVNVFYGDEYPAVVQLALNGQVEDVKVFKSIAFLCTFEDILNGLFHAPNDGDIYGKHPLGTRDRVSFINETHFTQQQGTQVASFRRDTLSVNAPLPLYANGEVLMTRWLSGKFICNNRKQYNLDSIIYLFSISPKSNTQ